ncbi:hypothetical protein NA57DRAFT_72427 [Rhizodiscina lignyota]|uniref:Uncharacterized protein n=1 Tax=Rhizodiscina lignyota TaxID=1504668 RepID=A0A9P4MA92_9PEZI|nr:hypothetical protein NA57DRAFT_72427 [Rhizodiscina lignyota]
MEPTPTKAEGPPPAYGHAANHQPPTYATTATPRGSSAADRTQRRPSRPMTAAQREKLLMQFAEERSMANDYWGGQKGSCEFAPNDPFKPFRWMKRKLSGQKGPSSSSITGENGERTWAVDGEIAKGDVDCSRLA